MNFLKAKIKAGEPVLGIWNIIPSATICEIIGHQGFDFQILDLEHGVFDFPVLEACIRACELTGSSPMVRVQGPEAHASIQTALDLGAHGIIVPQIEDSVHAQTSLESTFFAPKGRRGFNPFTRAGKYLPTSHPVLALTDEFAVRSVIVETVSAFEDLDRLLTLPEIDIVYLGVYDMSVALKCRGDFENPLIKNFLKTSIPKIRAAGKAAGVMAKTSAEITAFAELGANFIVAGVDTQLIASSFQTMRANFEKACGVPS